MVLPFALVNLRAACGHVAGRFNAERCGRRAVGLAMGLVLTADVVMHLPGRAPGPIEALVDPRVVYGKGPGVNVRVVRSLITHYLASDDASVLAQFYTFPSIPQRRLMYLTFFDRRQFLEGQLRPKYVLMDLGAPDPWVPPEDLRNMVMLLRRGDTYRPLYDAAGVLLYQRVGHDGR